MRRLLILFAFNPLIIVAANAQTAPGPSGILSIPLAKTEATPLFEAVTMGSRALSQPIDSRNEPSGDDQKVHTWVTQAFWGTTGKPKLIGTDVSGWGLSGGADVGSRFGSFGASVAYLNSQSASDTDPQVISVNQYEIAAYWKARWKSFGAYARISDAIVQSDGTTPFGAVIANTVDTSPSETKWTGALMSAAGGIGYEKRLGRISLRPRASVDYYTLTRGSFGSLGGAAITIATPAFASHELAINGSGSVGLNFGNPAGDGRWTALELELGRREIVCGRLADLIVTPAVGQSLIYNAEKRRGGWIGKLRATSGGSNFHFEGETAAEQRVGRVALSIRAAAYFGF